MVKRLTRTPVSRTALIMAEMEALQDEMRGWMSRFYGVDAEDLIQETTFRAISHRSSWRGRNLRAWLFTILRNLVYEQWRRRKVILPYDDFEGLINGLCPASIRKDGSVLDDLVAAETMERLRRAGRDIDQRRARRRASTYEDMLRPPYPQDGAYRARRFRFVQDLRSFLSQDDA